MPALPASAEKALGPVLAPVVTSQTTFDDRTQTATIRVTMVTYEFMEDLPQLAARMLLAALLERRT